MSSDVLILIPARYQSTRFPGKPLAKILEKSMIHRVYDNCASTGHDTYVITDNEEIEQAVKAFGGNVVRVDDNVSTGSERLYLAYTRHFSEENYQFIINVQGDEPLLKAEELKNLISFHKENKQDFFVTTLLYPRATKRETGESESLDPVADFKNPNIVKCTWVNATGQCLYFSRSPIPYDREGNGIPQENINWFQHIGVYSFLPEALLKFHQWPEGHYESVEKLEQLRFLENGEKIGAVLTQKKLVGVDHPEDIKKVEDIIRLEEER